jgi:hypothetical protein
MTNDEIEQLQADADSAIAAYETITQMHTIAIADAQPGDDRTAYEAAANWCSGFGTTTLPPDLAHTIARAIEVGYLVALADLRSGDLDQEWRDSGGPDRAS